MGLPPLRAGYPAAPDLLARRARMPVAWTPEMLAPGTAARDETIGGVACLVCEPTDMRPHPPAVAGERISGAILYFHGGGYRLGSPAAWAHLASRLAAATGRPVIVPDYRLAPEHPFPAALYDAVAVYRVLANADGTLPILAGDSAGGGLAASLTLACADLDLPVPVATILFSPWLDLACPTDRACTDRLFPRQAALDAALLYLQGHPPADPFASPLAADLAGFPPSLIFASANEYLLDDATTLERRLDDANVFVKSYTFGGMPHAWPVTAPDSRETEMTLRAVASFTSAL